MKIKPIANCAALLMLLAVGGCATPGSVDALDPRLKEITGKMDKIEKDMEAAEEMIKSVNDVAKKATKSAEQALKTGQNVSEKLKQ